MTSTTITDAIARREAVLSTFLEREQERLALACHAMAGAFSRGGTLIPFGTGAAATDAAHVAVEFMHPVIVGKRALPALASAGLAAGRPGDIALGLAHRRGDRLVEGFLVSAAKRGLLTIGFGAEPMDADFAFAVDSDDPVIVQEVQETAYHVLWELVHVFFEHPGLLQDSCITCGDVAVETDVVAVRGATAVVRRGGAEEEVAIDLLEGVQPGDRLLCHAGVALEKLEADPAGFLYPFLGAAENDLDAVLADVRASTVRKGRDTIALRRGIDLDALTACAADVKRALECGGRLLAFGNGGSATDAGDVA